MAWVPSARGEQAAALIMRELAEYRVRAVVAGARSNGRLLARRTASTGLPAGYGSVVSIVSIVEEFFVSSLHLRVSAAFDVTSRLIEDAQSEVLKEVDSTWPRRQTAAKNWYGIDGSTVSSYTRFMAFVEARNSITHGLGRLTRRQLANDGGKQTLSRLAAVGIAQFGGRLVIEGATVVSCAQAARDTVVWCDEAITLAKLMPPRTP